MKFSAREDIAAPMDEVFAAVTDFARLERQALRRGVEVERLDTLEAPGVGSAWRLRFSYRGRQRVTETRITAFAPDQSLAFTSEVEGLNCDGHVDLTRLSAKKTRLHVTFDIRPGTFRARMLVQGLRLAKSGLSRRFKRRVAQIAREIDRA